MLKLHELSGCYQKQGSGIILEHIVNMAQKLDMVVIAEGVENKEQLELLDNMGCDLFQGYYFSKPVAIDDFIKYADK